jgi:hypothetical protein
VQSTLVGSGTQQYYARIQFQYTQISFNGFVALDDIIVHEGECKFSSDVELCTFEDTKLCNYTNDATANFNWKLGNGTSQAGLSTGPKTDVIINLLNKKLL